MAKDYHVPVLLHHPWVTAFIWGSLSSFIRNLKTRTNSFPSERMAIPLAYFGTVPDPSNVLGFPTSNKVTNEVWYFKSNHYSIYGSLIKSVLSPSTYLKWNNLIFAPHQSIQVGSSLWWLDFMIHIAPAEKIRFNLQNRPKLLGKKAMGCPSGLISSTGMFMGH